MLRVTPLEQKINEINKGESAAISGMEKKFKTTVRKKNISLCAYQKLATRFCPLNSRLSNLSIDSGPVDLSDGEKIIQSSIHDRCQKRTLNFK